MRAVVPNAPASSVLSRARPDAPQPPLHLIRGDVEVVQIDSALPMSQMAGAPCCTSGPPLRRLAALLAGPTSCAAVNAASVGVNSDRPSWTLSRSQLARCVSNVRFRIGYSRLCSRTSRDWETPWRGNEEGTWQYRTMDGWPGTGPRWLATGSIGRGIAIASPA